MISFLKRLWCRIAHRDEWRIFPSEPGHHFCLHCGSRHKVRGYVPAPHLSGEALQHAIEGFNRQAIENYEVSREIQLRDGVDRKGRKIKRSKV